MQTTRKTLIVVCIAMLVAALHIIMGRYDGVFVNGYLSDLLLPFTVYLLLCLRPYPILRQWWGRGLLVFSMAAGAETVQFFDIYALGETFDPVDYGMYGAGVGVAILLDMVVLPRLLPFWR